MLKCLRKTTQTNGPPKNKIKLLRDIRVPITDGAWKLGNYAELLSSQSKLNCQILILQNNLDCCILKSIRHIQFSNLKRLFLAHNRIETIQPISQMALPSLQYLDLINNRINCLRPFKRAFFPKLKVLHIAANPIYESEVSVFAAFIPNLRIFSSDYFNFHNPIFEDICSLVKLQSAKIEELYFDSYRRIIQKKVVKVMIQRFPSAELAKELMISESDQCQSKNSDEIWHTKDSDSMNDSH